MQKKKTIYRMIDISSIVIFVATFIILIVFWKKIPDTIPTHFNAAGIADNYGDKTTLILLVFGEVFTLGSMIFASAIVKMTSSSGNKTGAEEAILQTISPMLSVLNLVLVCMFAYMFYCSAACKPLGIYFLPITLIATFFPIIYFMCKYVKLSAFHMKQYNADMKEKEQGSVRHRSYRSKIDWWLGGLLIISCLLPLWVAVLEFLDEGQIDMWIVIVELFIVLLIVPLFFIKYKLYEEHLNVQFGIYGSYRIPYSSITGIKKTMNPLSSAAMSLKRIQIDYMKNGSHGLILISPVDRDEFIKILNEKCELQKLKGC